MSFHILMKMVFWLLASDVKIILPEILGSINYL